MIINELIYKDLKISKKKLNVEPIMLIFYFHSFLIDQIIFEKNIIHSTKKEKKILYLCYLLQCNNSILRLYLML